MSEKIMKVLANVSQDLTDGEKHQARSNIGAIAGVNVATAGGTTPLVPDENDRVTVDLTDIEGGVPPYTSSDEGKVLGVTGTTTPTLDWVSPSFAQEQADWTEQDSSDPSYIKNKPNLATVAYTGAYSDLSGTPTIPAAQVQSDWAQTNTSAVDFIKNKPSIPSKTSDLTNDSGFITAADEAVKDVTQNGSSVVNAQGVAEIVTRDVPSSTSSDSGKVLTVDSSGSPVWTTPSGGQSYTAGNGIDITSDVISAKLDGSTLTNGSNGLSVTNPVPDTTGASQGDVLSVGSSGIEWVTPSGGSSSVVYVTTSNTYEEVYAIYDAGKLPVLKAGVSANNQYQYALTQVDLSSGHYLHRGVMLFTRWDASSTNAYTYCMTGNFGIGQYACWRNAQGVTQWSSNFSSILPSYSSADSGKVLTVDTNNEPAWVTPSGGTTYSAGSGINIANDTISAKVDGSSITVNASGELQATASSLQTKPLVAGTGITLTASASDVTISADSQLPSYSSADSGKSLVVNGNGDGVTWDRKISGVMYNGASSSELRHIRLNTYNNPSTPGLVAAFPAGAQGVSCGFLMPDPGFVADETVDKVARIIENPNNSGVCMLAYQDDAAVISPLEKVSITTSTNPYEINAQPGKWYEIICSQSTAQTWHIYLEANSTVTTNTVHTIVRITRTDSSVSCSPSLVWHDERGIIHYEQCDLTGTTSYYDFDCLVRKNGYTVEGTPWSFARVRRV